ncbi:MAG: hypothetical protein FJX42_10505 [Alphaproteobacteria bacterium]|nr:hypothetical protein [Alphaproteobacteria bacterium]
MSDEKPPSSPFSDHTRRLRRNLIVVAAMGILLAKFPEITLEKIPTSIGELAAKELGRNIVVGGTNIICAYLLVFLFGMR